MSDKLFFNKFKRFRYILTGQMSSSFSSNVDILSTRFPVDSEEKSSFENSFQ